MNRNLAMTMLVAVLTMACADRHDLPVPVDAHVVDDPALGGLSGLVHSLDHDGVLWAVNDYDVVPRLFRIGPQGETLGRVRVRGTLSFNSESLALWDPDDEPHDWILIGDIGDNHDMRRRLHVHAVMEPALDDSHARIAWTLSYRYPDGPREAEAMTVDHQLGKLLVISKYDQPARMYSVPLAAREASGTVEATFVAALPEGMGSVVTGMRLSRDGCLLAVLTYESVYLWTRVADEDWASVLASTPERIALPDLPKAEGIALAPQPDGTIFVGSERSPALLLPIPRD